MNKEQKATWLQIYCAVISGAYASDPEGHGVKASWAVDETDELFEAAAQRGIVDPITASAPTGQPPTTSR